MIFLILDIKNRMKSIIIGLSLFFVFVVTATAQIYDKQCYYGISFEKSENRNWGYGELVVTDVDPNSPAEAAGIRVNDIIMEINGQATYLRDNSTISDWLFNNPDPVVKFTLRNVDTYFREYTLNRECITVNSVDEEYLAKIFSLYSLENTREQKFTLPLQIKPTPGVDYTDYHTYAFYNDGSDIPAVEYRLQEILERSLNDLGLTKDEKDPDIWINLYYEHVPNPNFTGIGDSGKAVFTQRFNMETRKMEKYPIYDVNDPDVNMKGQYIVKLGFAFYEKKYIDKGNFTQMWECNIQDYLSANLSLEDYAQIHIPLILMQYPYATEKNECEYFVNFNKHYYTGIHFDADNMAQINDVDPNSPAFKAGIRSGYRINKINNKKFDFTTDQFSESYKTFVTDTESYRNKNTQFTGVEGYQCSFWDPGYYTEIAKAFRNPKYITSFSYLFNFERYVNPALPKTLEIDLMDGAKRKIIVVEPVIKEYTVIKAL